MAERHARDVFSLVLGLLLVAVGVLFLVVDGTGAEPDLRWLAPAVLIAIGTTGLLASLRR